MTQVLKISLCVLFQLIEVIFGYSQTAQAYLDSALISKNQNELQSGIDFCSKAIELNDAMEETCFYRAGFHVAWITRRDAGANYQHYKTAIADYTKVLEFNLRHDQALFFRGGTHGDMVFFGDGYCRLSSVS